MEVGKTYGAKELANEMNITYDNFKKQRDKYLSNLGLYYKYKVNTNGRGSSYTILEKIGDYEPPERIHMRRMCRDVYLTDAITQAIKDNWIQTSTNVARIIANDERVKSLDLTESTLQRYTGVIMKKLFGGELFNPGTRGRITGEIRCHLIAEENRYEPLTEGQRYSLKTIRDEHRQRFYKVIASVEHASRIGAMSVEQRAAELLRLNTLIYQAACDEFRELWGFEPVKAYLYELNAWDWETGEVILENEIEE